MKETVKNDGWHPKFTLDLTVARDKAFEELVNDFAKWAKEQPLPEFTLTDGWHFITPQMAEELLMRNRANRKVSLGTVIYYGDQMKRDDWPKTGQPITFFEDGDRELGDGQHRLWASYLNGVGFWTFVVTTVPRHPRLFAYYDNGKVRSAANALQTAGMDGVSPIIVKVLQMAFNNDRGYLTVSSVKRHARLSPVQFLDMLAHYPNAVKACQLAAADYSEASTLLGDSSVIGYAAMIMLDANREDLADQFFNELGGVELTDDDGAVAALIKVYQNDSNKAKNRLKPHQKLGYLINAFNSWIEGKRKRNWDLKLDAKNWPAFNPIPSGEAAAE